MLMNIRTLSWDDELLGVWGIPRKMLPDIRSSSEVYAHVSVESRDYIPTTTSTLADNEMPTTDGEKVENAMQNVRDAKGSIDNIANTADTVACECTDEPTENTGLTALSGVPIAGILGDQQAALFGQVWYG